MSIVFAHLPHIDFCVPSRPHIDFIEGGHLFIEPADKSITERCEISTEDLLEMSLATQLLGAAIQEVFPQYGVELYRLNYQDNGNWSFLRGEVPLMHIHIYGRAQNETKQSFGQALVFPPPDDAYYDTLEAVPNEVLAALYRHMKQSLRTCRFTDKFSEEDLLFVLK